MNRVDGTAIVSREAEEPSIRPRCPQLHPHPRSGTIFVGEIRSGGAGRLLFGLFGGALVCSIAALGAFSFEMVLAGRAVRERSEGDDG